MPISTLLELLFRITPLSLEFKRELPQVLHEENYRVHQIIHAAGQIENRLWFLETGLVRSYYFDATGKEHTLAFYTEMAVIFSYPGYWKEASDYYIEALSQVRLISLSYESLAILRSHHPEVSILTQHFMRRHHAQESYRCRLLTWAAEERYLQFRKSHPEIFRMASLRLIASYLNMTRENLSRLMGRDL